MISLICLALTLACSQKGLGQDVTLTLDKQCYNIGDSMTLSVTYGGSGTVSGVEWFYSGRDSQNIILLTDCSVFQTDTGFPSGITYKCPPDTVDSNTYQLILGSVSASELDTTTWGATFQVSTGNLPLETVQPVSCISLGQDVTLTLDKQCYNIGDSMTLSVTYGGSGTVSGVEWFYSGRDSQNIILLTDCSVFQTDTGFPSGITYKCPPDTVDSNTYQLILGSVSASELDTTTWGATFQVSTGNLPLETVQPVSCIKSLKKKPASLDAFLRDIEWALYELTQTEAATNGAPMEETSPTSPPVDAETGNTGGRSTENTTNTTEIVVIPDSSPQTEAATNGAPMEETSPTSPPVEAETGNTDGRSTENTTNTTEIVVIPDSSPQTEAATNGAPMEETSPTSPPVEAETGLRDIEWAQYELTQTEAATNGAPMEETSPTSPPVEAETGNTEGRSTENTTNTTEIVVIPDSDNDSSQSDVFPLLTEKNLKLSSPAGSDAYKEDIDGRDKEDCDGRVFARDVVNKNIYVSGVKKSFLSKSGQRKKNDRVHNSRHPCPFCNVTKSNFSHHIFAKKHEMEEAVIEIKNAKNDKERKHLISRLRMKASHDHNMRILKEKKGEVFLLRRSNADDSESDDSDEDEDSDIGKSFDISHYGPCPSCFGWVQKKSLRRHNTSCTSANPGSWSNRALEVQSDMISGKLTSEASQALINEVFPIMIGDNISKVAKEDELIVNLGNQWLMRNRGNEIMRKYYTSTVMRLAAKLKVACQTLSRTTLNITDYLAPKHFQTVLKAALSCCHIDDVEEDLKAPSNAIKLGFDIKRMLSAKLSKAIMAGNNELQKEATDFLKLMEIQWGLRVTKLARGLLVERSFNQTNELPRPADVKRLYEYLQTKIRGLNLKDTSFINFRKAAILTLARLTLYNRRRCHEVQAMRLNSYAARRTGIDEVGAEIRGELTEFEQQLLIRQEVVVIRGKTGRGVPVIIPPDVVQSLEFLTSVEVRTQAGIPEDNKFVFGNQGVAVFRAYDAIREVTQSPEADLQMPDLIRTSNMRKYMATMLQALNTTESERQWVLDHLGHTMNVHRVHYRQTSDVLERVDVAKILLIQDLGLVSKFRGKRIQDIQIKGGGGGIDKGGIVGYIIACVVVIQLLQ